jgi:hypothetical protein
MSCSANPRRLTSGLRVAPYLSLCPPSDRILSTPTGIDNTTFRTLAYGVMQASDRPDIEALEASFNAAERDARALVAGLSEKLGAWRAEADSWSVAECLDHLATANRVYLRAMQPAGERAVREGRRRRRPAQPGLIGSWFIRTLEPPVKPLFRGKAPQSIRPRPSPALHDAIGEFLASQNEVRTFLQKYADIDLVGVRFLNPFVRGVRFSLATGLHVIAAHERRHLWQAWRVRQAAERATGA